MINMSKFKKSIVGFLPILLVCIVVGQAAAATLTQDYNTKQKVPHGSIVSLSKQAGEVVLASSDNIANLYGVAVKGGDISFNQTSNASSEIISVASGGVVTVLASDNNGEIKSGDPITVDNVAGIGQKATKSGKIVGIAQSALNVRDSAAKQVSIDQNNSNKNITINTIQIKVGVTEYAPPTNNSGNRNKILQIVDGIVGKEVKPYGVIVAGLILLVCIFVSVFLVTSSGYASMISIGRNPLSEKKIILSLLRMLGIAIVIFMVGLLLSYGILQYI